MDCQVLDAVGFGIINAALALGYKRLADRLKHKSTEDKAVRDGVLAMLHDRLYQSCRFYFAQGWVDIKGLKNIEYLYDAYHALGGNGTGTDLYNRVRAMPIKED